MYRLREPGLIPARAIGFLLRCFFRFIRSISRFDSDNRHVERALFGAEHDFGNIDFIFRQITALDVDFWHIALFGLFDITTGKAQHCEPACGQGYKFAQGPSPSFKLPLNEDPADPFPPFSR